MAAAPTRTMTTAGRRRATMRIPTTVAAMAATGRRRATVRTATAVAAVAATGRRRATRAAAIAASAAAGTGRTAGTAPSIRSTVITAVASASGSPRLHDGLPHVELRTGRAALVSARTRSTRIA